MISKPKKSKKVSEIRGNTLILNASPGSAVCKLGSREKFDAIREVIEKCSVFKSIKPESAFIEAVMSRESIESTGIGHGVAVAHGKIDTIQEITIGLGISTRGIPFGAVDGKPVHILFVIGSSPDRQDEYLNSLASLMRFIKNPTFRAILVNKHEEFFKQEEDHSLFIKMLKTQKFSYC